MGRCVLELPTPCYFLRTMLPLTLSAFFSFVLPYAHAFTSSYQLRIANKAIAPDGYRRRYGVMPYCRMYVYSSQHSAVLANERFPGPIISTNKGSKLQVSSIDLPICWFMGLRVLGIDQCRESPHRRFYGPGNLHSTGSYLFISALV